MDHRIGTCSSCDARYRIPASFEADRAKCKKCGGIVEIAAAKAPSPAKRDKPKAPPARTSRPRNGKPKTSPGAAAPAASKQPKTGPSMKEQILARRAAEAKPGAEASEATPRKASSTGKAAAARGNTKRETTPGRTPRSGATSRRKAAAGSRQRPAKGDADAKEDGRRRGRPAPKKGNPVPMFIGSAVVLVLLGYGIWEMYLKAPEPSAPEQASVVEETQESQDEADATASSVAGGADEQGAAAEASAPAADPVPEKPKPKKLHDPSSVDLAAIADYAPFAGTSDDTWNELRRDMAEFVDPNSGAAGNRARKRLEATPRQAFPVILNFFKRMDFATDEGHRNGDLCQKLLMDLCGGRNFGWKYGDVEENERVTFNKKVVRSWCRSWDQANEDTLEGNQAWAKLSKQDEKTGDAKPAAAEAGPELGTGDLDDLDDF